VVQLGSRRAPDSADEIAMLKRAVLAVISFAILSGGTYLALERPSWVPLVGEKDKILVMLVANRAGVARVRASVDPARIVAESADAIALVEGRIIAAGAEAVSGPYTEAGWMDRELQFLSVAQADPMGAARQANAGGAGVDPERQARIRELVSKPTLSAGEQMFVLQAMNDGVEF
jgi:hypothetical protein